MYMITIKKTSLKMQPASQEYKSHAKPADEEGDTWGYVTKPPCEKVVIETVFEQQIDELNMLDILAAINGVEFK